MAHDEVVVPSAEESLTTPLLELAAAASPRDPSVEVRLYRRGAGPAKVFRSALRGPRRDRLDVRGIQAEHGLRALFAFKPEVSRRGLRIRPDPAAGHSALPFRDGAAIALDGEPKVSWTKPASMIAAGLLVPAVMAALAFNGVPESLRSSSVVNAVFSPWILASLVIIFVRLRMRPQAPPERIRATWETILNNADVGSSEAAVDIFEGVAIISPRGRYTVELHLSFLRLRGQANDIIIVKYSSIVRLFILPKVKSAWHGAGSNDRITFVVVTLDPPVRKGKTLYPHIVIQFPTEVMVETDLNLSRDLLDRKYKDKLEESYMGPMHEVFTEVLTGLSGAKVSTPGSFRTCLDGYAVKTSLKSEHGLLYPHENCFFFLPRPPMIIPYEEIEFVGFGRYCREGARKSSCYFDVLVKRKNDQEHIFRKIQRNEYHNLFSFFNGKHLKIIHLGDGEAGDEQSDEEDDNFDLHMDGGYSTDDSSGDESESSESGGEKEKSSKKEASSSKPPTKRKKCNGMDNEYSKIRKWKKKRCHNVPKRSIPPFMYFSIAERARLKKENPDLPIAEIAMKLGQVWQNMSDEAKQPYIQAVIRERKRFEKKKRTTYRWHSMNLSEKEIKITYGEEGSSVSHARNCTINGT